MFSFYDKQFYGGCKVGRNGGHERVSRRFSFDFFSESSQRPYIKETVH